MKKFSIYLSCALVALALSACDKDNDNGPDDSGSTNTENNGSNSDSNNSASGEVSNLTVAEQKDFIEKTAIEALQLINSSDYKAFADFMQQFEQQYGDYELPDSWYGDDYDYKPARKTDLTRSVYYYTVRFYDYTGIYTAKNGEWVKTGNSDNQILFKFTLNGQNCEISATGTGENPEISWKEEYDYNYSDVYQVYPPKKVVFYVKQGSTTLAEGSINADINLDNHNISMSANVTVSKLNINYSIKGTDSQISGNGTVTIGGQNLLTLNAQILGSNLCNPTNWQMIAEGSENMSEEAAAAMLNNILTSATTSVDIIGKLQLEAAAKNFGSVMLVADSNYDSYDYDDQKAAQSACLEACKTLNKNVTSTIYFNGQRSEQASLYFQPYLYSDSSYWEYYPEAAVKFADGSIYSFEQYFEKFHFADLEFQWNLLLKSFANLWK